MSIFSRKKQNTRSRDRPASHAMPIWTVLRNAKAQQDLKGSEAVYSAVSRISNTIACMPLHLYRAHEIAASDPRERCMAYAPNEALTPYGFKLSVEACRDTYGTAYVLIVPDSDGVTVARLDPIDPARVQPLRCIDTQDIWYQITLDDGTLATVHSTRMIVLHHMSTDGVNGISPVEVLGGTLNYDRKIQEISLQQLEGVKDSIVLTYPTNLNGEKRAEYTKAFLDAYKKSNGHLIILDGGVTADTIKGSMVDAKVLDVDSITKRKVAAVYNMPPRMLGDSSASGYSTSEQDIGEFLKLTILPIVKQWEEALNRRLLTYDEVRAGYAFRFDMDALKRGDTAAMADKHQKGVRSGVLKPNEARAENGLPPAAYGDELFISRDMIPVRVVVEHPELLLGGSSTADT